MVGKIHTFFLVAAAAVFVFAAPALADEESRYSEWQAEDGVAGGNEALEALARDLEALIDDAERMRAADPRFLQDLREKIATYRRDDRQAAVRDDFADGDFTHDPQWEVVRGDFAVDPALGLRTVMPVAGAGGESEGTLDTILSTGKSALDAGKSVIGDLLGEEGAEAKPEPDADAASTGPEPAEIVLAQRFGNAFTLEATVTSRIAARGARLEIDVFMGGTRGAGYRLAYLPGGDPALELSRFGRSGVSVIAEYDDPLTLEDGSEHKISFMRDADGTMTVSVDGAALIRIRSGALTDPFDGLALVNAGGDYAIRTIAVYDGS